MTAARGAVPPPLASLLAKLEKAQGGLAPGTWQHAMVRQDLAALRLSAALLQGAPAARFPRQELRDAARALAALEAKARKARASFAAGTPHHTLQRNRLDALAAAAAAVRSALAAGRRRRRLQGIS